MQYQTPGIDDSYTLSISYMKSLSVWESVISLIVDLSTLPFTASKDGL